MTAAVELWDTQQKAIIKEQIARDCSDGELRLFAQVCAKTGLDPFSRQIYAIKRSGRMSIQTSIDGFRVIAERSRDYEGQTPKQWCGPDGKWVDVWLAKDMPAAARVGVWRKGFREPLYAIATWKEYAQDSPMWKKMGPHMLAKCAESQALRAAFPNDLSGLYTSDEMPSTPVVTVDTHDEYGPTTTRVSAPQLPPAGVDASTGEILSAAIDKFAADHGDKATEFVEAITKPRTFAPPSQSKQNTTKIMQDLGEKPRTIDKAKAVKGVDPIGDEQFAAFKARKAALSERAAQQLLDDLKGVGMTGFSAKSTRAEAEQVDGLLMAAEALDAEDREWSEQAQGQAS